MTTAIAGDIGNDAALFIVGAVTAVAGLESAGMAVGNIRLRVTNAPRRRRARVDFCLNAACQLCGSCRLAIVSGGFMRNNCASAARYCDSPIELVSWCEPPLTSTNIFGTVAASYSLRPSVGLMRLSAEPCTTSRGAPMFFTLSIASKRCVMKGAERQPAPLETARHIGNRGEGALDDGPALVFDVRGQVDADGTTERVAEDVATLLRVRCSQPLPGRTGVFTRRCLRRQAGRALAEAAVVDRQHRETQLVHAADTRCGAGDVVSGAVQKKQNGGVDRFGRAAEPQTMQASGLRRDVRFEVDPDVGHAFGHGCAVAPAHIAGLENPFTLALVERRASTCQQGKQGDDGGKERPTFHEVFTRLASGAESSTKGCTGEAMQRPCPPFG